MKGHRGTDSLACLAIAGSATHKTRCGAGAIHECGVATEPSRATHVGGDIGRHETTGPHGPHRLPKTWRSRWIRRSGAARTRAGTIRRLPEHVAAVGALRWPRLLGLFPSFHFGTSNFVQHSLVVGFEDLLGAVLNVKDEISHIVIHVHAVHDRLAGTLGAGLAFALAATAASRRRRHGRSSCRSSSSNRLAPRSTSANGHCLLVCLREWEYGEARAQPNRRWRKHASTHRQAMTLTRL